jgi:hypothetical protein
MVDKSSEILLQGTIQHFGLTIRLRMISSAHTQLCARQLKQLTPELANKDGVSIGDEAPGHAMVFTDHI